MSINYDKFNTYMAASSAFTPGALPEDVFTVTGNATTNVYVLKMGLSTTQTTAGSNPWFLKKRSTANSGGTSATVTGVPVQSGNAAAAATVRQYTVTPTGVGTPVGSLWSGWLNSAKIDTAGVAGFEGVELDFESMLGQPIALLSASEVLSWSFNAGTLPAGLSVLAWVLWAESSKT
jgi:hypothetical protein